jgi:hypothetical protein
MSAVMRRGREDDGRRTIRAVVAVGITHTLNQGLWFF